MQQQLPVVLLLAPVRLLRVVLLVVVVVVVVLLLLTPVSTADTPTTWPGSSSGNGLRTKTNLCQ